MTKLKLVIVGAKGRMGTRIAELAMQDPAFEIAARLDIGSKPEDIRPGQVLIDFSQPDASLPYLKEAAAQGKPCVIGTTGFSAEHERTIQDHARKIAIVNHQAAAVTRELRHLAQRFRRQAVAGHHVNARVLDLKERMVNIHRDDLAVA